MSRIGRVGDVRITGKELREGILGADTWPLIFEQNDAKWKSLGGLELRSVGPTAPPTGTPTFNYFPRSEDAVIEWSEETSTAGRNVSAAVAEGAVIDVATMPYLNRPETYERPTLLSFEITGHVMLGIVYQTKRGPEIHILNPWDLFSNAESAKDVFRLLLESLGPSARNVIVVDVVAELERKYKRTINLQEFEKMGFCTLWVGILARGAIPYLGQLQDSIRNVGLRPGADQTLNDQTLALYSQIYTGIETRWSDVLADAKRTFGEDKCPPTASAATAAVTLAREAMSGGKRKYIRRRKTMRAKKSRWTKKRRSLR
jgi:hypothetical protein